MTEPGGLPVVRVELDDARDVSVPGEAGRALAVVTLGGRVIGEAEVPLDVRRGRAMLLAALAAELGDSIWIELLRDALARATRGSRRPSRPAAPLTTSVVVEVGSNPHDLPRCLESVGGLETAPDDVIVVGGGPEAARTSRAHGARWVAAGGDAERAVLDSEADVVAFTRAACTVDPRWLDGIEQAFFDPLVMAVAGYVGPASLEGAPELLLQRRGGFGHRGRPPVVDGPSSASPVRAAAVMRSWGNLFLRRRVLPEVGVPVARRPAGRDSTLQLYALYRVLRAGFRIAYDPARIVWHRHPATAAGARRALAGAAGSQAAYACLCLLWHGETGAARLIAKSLLGGASARLRGRSLSVASAELTGAAAGLLGALRDARPGHTNGAAPEPFVGIEPAARERIGPASEAPRLSVVLPSFNRRELLRRVLEALEAQDYPPERYEVVVVLDGSTDGSAELVRSRRPAHALRLLEQPNRGLAAARNAGARAAAAPLLVFLDDDIVPDRGFLAGHAAAHRRPGSREVAVGACVSAIDGRRLWALLRRTWWEDHFTRKAEPDHPWTALDYSAGNSSLERELFFECGAFDERFERRNEEQELGLRLARSGARFGYRLSARGRHHFQADFRAALAEHRAQAVSDVLLARKHPRLRSRVTVAAYARPNRYGVSGRAYLAYRHAGRIARLVPLGVRLAEASEALRLRRTYRLLTGWLMAHAYLTGMKDVLPGPCELVAFLKPFGEERPSTVLPVRIGEPGRLRVPAEGGNLALRVMLDGHVLCEVTALEPAREWSWDEVLGRLAAVSLAPAKRAIALERLARAASELEAAA